MISKLQTVAQMDQTQPQREVVRTLAELQRQIEALQPQQQVQMALDELAVKVEPLAQAMVTLTEETRQTLAEIDRKSSEKMQKMQQQVEVAATAATAAAKEIETAARKAGRASKDMTWRLLLVAIFAGMMSAALTTGLLIWLLPPQMQRPIVLDSAAVAKMILD